MEQSVFYGGSSGHNYLSEKLPDEPVYHDERKNYRILRMNDGSGIYHVCDSGGFCSASSIVQDDRERNEPALIDGIVNLHRVSFCSHASFSESVQNDPGAGSLLIPPCTLSA